MQANYITSQKQYKNGANRREFLSS